MNSLILLVPGAQIALAAYRWRARTRMAPFVLGGLAALGAWAAVLFTPLATHSVVVDMPRSNEGLSQTVSTVGPILAAVVVVLLIIGVNQLLLFGVRAIVDRIWLVGGSSAR